ncbi:MAG: competence/damage-inducible protein A [Veillonella sp.]|uniref:competence/damage-inducible protein A n=1 Tax=Veillonella sp. TaxID=1926307 RepID=UPI0025EAC37E|nr:competence/damage-inducible protein A [Veillonella sp.]MBS4913990.1 competence/damage-inducible protein A [Veillonella sp.]
MIVELISTGSELLLGDTVNTNVTWLAKELNKIGYTVAYQTVVGDNPARMSEVFSVSAKRADIVISTGGLGPTDGDITRNVLADTIGVPLELNTDAERMVESYFKRKDFPMPEKSRREMFLPAGSKALTNSVGVAPGVVTVSEDCTFILLPGPPAEMKAVFAESVVPYLDETFGPQGVIHSHRYAVYGIKEIALEERLGELFMTQSNPTIACLIKNGYIEVRLTASAESIEAAEALLAPWDKALHERLGEHVGRTLDQSVLELTADALLETKSTVATAESCTGGLVGKYLTDLPGSSAYMRGGVISYDNEIKHEVLGVSADDLATYGAVSETVARQMAEGTRKLMKTTYGVSTTGIAGPGGATDTKPVGLVYIGIAGPKGTKVYKNQFIGNRHTVRESTVEQVLYYLYDYIKHN